MTQYPKSASNWARILMRNGLRCVPHLLGVCLVGGLLLVPFLNRVAFDAIVSSAQQDGFFGLIWVDLALYMGLAACLWAMVVILFEVVTSRRAPVHRALRLGRGSVMTETLIILPVFLLLTFGIAQLAINNVAGLLANTAAFQAGRTAWLWTSEADVQRSGVTSEMVRELTHVQAAAVLTPVAPGEFIQTTGGGSQQFRQMRGILVGSQLFAFSSDSGNMGMSQANLLMAGDNMTSFSGRDASFSRALDNSSWKQRTARKFTFAYHATEVRVINNGDEAGVELTYLHHQAFPLVGRIFGDPHFSIGGRKGFYAEMKRTFTLPKQREPNKARP